MTQLADVRVESAPSLAGGARGFVRWVCTSNPFYVLSAGLFLGGLWASFGKQAEAGETWALMFSLFGYTLLLAGTAFLLVRFGQVWDDVRTVLLLVVLMFLATSVTFDGVLVRGIQKGTREGFTLYLGGLCFAVLVSEGLLRGIRLVLPALFRVPYYLILTLFFVYPLALSPFLGQPHSEVTKWALFSFSGVAGLIFLTLLPAIRRGPGYVNSNGSPWSWPLFPWVLFGLLGCAVAGRAFLLCWSMHLLGFRNLNWLIFGPYFLVPFALAVAVLVLEIGLVSRHRGVLGAALVLPAGLVLLATLGHRPDPIYQGFLRLFADRLGGDPLYVTLQVATVFYGYAALRRVPLAAEALTGALATLAFIGPDTLQTRQFTSPQPLPILLATTLQLTLALWQRSPGRSLFSAAGLVAVAWLAMPLDLPRLAIVFHLVLLAGLILGAIFDELLGQLLRVLGTTLVMLGCLAVIFLPAELAEILPPWMIDAYPPSLAGFLTVYGLGLRHRLSIWFAGLIMVCWLSVAGCWGYYGLRQEILGLDYLALSLALFVLALLISLGKAGLLRRWLIFWREKLVYSMD